MDYRSVGCHGQYVHTFHYAEVFTGIAFVHNSRVDKSNERTKSNKAFKNCVEFWMLRRLKKKDKKHRENHTDNNTTDTRTSGDNNAHHSQFL